MDIRTQVTIWVEKKFGKLIRRDINDVITKETSTFDVESYVNDLLEKAFKGKEVDNLKEALNDYFSRDVDSDNSGERENNSQDSFEFESQDFHTLSTEEIIQNLKNNSLEIRINSLKALELSAEDLINQSSWITVKKILEKMLQFNEDVKIHNLVLKVFQKFLMCSSKPQLVCEGFITLTDVISYQIELINTQDENISFEEMYDLKKDKWLYKKLSADPEKSVTDGPPKGRKTVDPDILIKLMWLLIDCQKQVSEKWIRFHQKRFREIIFSFIHLLASTNNSEKEKLSALEIVSVLNPTASWCLHWCHTATGRALLCSALRKYKNFFIHIVEIILSHMKIKKTSQSQSVREGRSEKNPSNSDKILKSIVKNSNSVPKIEEERKEREERSKWARSAPTENKERDRRKGKSSEWLIKIIPRRIVTQAVFSHSVFLVTYLIQFRSGRALFPIQTTMRKRLLSVHDLSHSMTDYLENFEYYEWGSESIPFTQVYKARIVEILEILKNVKANVYSSRLSADRLAGSRL